VDYFYALAFRDTGIDNEVPDEDISVVRQVKLYSYFADVRNNTGGARVVDAHPVIYILKYTKNLLISNHVNPHSRRV